LEITTAPKEACYVVQVPDAEALRAALAELREPKR
jgi:hypothetical protein